MQRLVKMIVIIFFTATNLTSLAQNFPEYDVDGDGVNNVDDACPYIAGPAYNKGCPDSTKAADKVWTYEKIADSKRKVFLDILANTYDGNTIYAAFRDFTFEITSQLGYTPPFDNQKLQYAIGPVMRSPKCSNDVWYAEQLARLWSEKTYMPFDSVINLMEPAAKNILLAEMATTAKEKKDAETTAALLKKAEQERLAAARKKLEQSWTPAQRTCVQRTNFFKEKYITEGMAVQYIGKEYIFMGYECRTDSVYLFTAGVGYHWPKASRVISGEAGLSLYLLSIPKKTICDACLGSGVETSEETKSYTQSLPQGYFSGIDVSKTYYRTTSKTVTCSKCKHTGLSNQLF